MKLIHKGLILIAVPLALEVFFVAGFADLLHRSVSAIDDEVHAKNVISYMDRLSALLTESATIAGMCHLYRNDAYRERFSAIWNEVTEDYSALRNLEKGDENSADLENLGQKLRSIHALSKLIATSPFMENYRGLSSFILGRNRDVSDVLVTWQRNRADFAPMYRMMRASVKTVNNSAALHAEIKLRFEYFLMIGVAVNALVVGALSWFFGKSIVVRLSNVMDNTVRLGKMKELRPPIAGSDEIAVLDSSLHKAALEIIEAETFKQQLVGVVSHEMKAPLSGVQALLSMLVDGLYGVLPPKALELVKSAELNCSNLMDMIMSFINRDKDADAMKEAEAQLPDASKAESLSSKPGGKFGLKQLRLWQKGVLLIGLPFVFEMILMAGLANLLMEANHELELQEHSRAVVSGVQKITEQVGDSFLLLVVYTGFGKESMRQAYGEARSKLQQSLQELKTKAAGDPVREQFAQSIEDAVGKEKQCVAEYEHEKTEKLKGYDEESTSFSELLASPKVADELFQCRRSLTDSIDALTKYEHDLQAKLKARDEKIVGNIDALLVAGVSVNCLLALSLLYFLVKDLTSKVALVAGNAEKMVNRQPLANPLESADELGQLDAAIHRVNQTLTEQLRIKRELVSIASNELSKPLQAIRSDLSRLSCGEGGALDEKPRAQVELAERGIGRLITLIGDLLSIEKMDAGKFVLEYGHHSIAALVNQAVSNVQGLADIKKISLETQIQDVALTVDAERIVQALVNLVSNAIKYSPRGTSVVISCIVADGKVRINVKDQGAGIPEDKQKWIFQRFHRLSQKPGQDPGGTGLGLSITKIIVEQHGGNVGLESLENFGSVFWIELPLASGSESTDS